MARPLRAVLIVTLQVASFVAAWHSVAAQESAASSVSAATLLEESIAYHDPSGRWVAGAQRLEIGESRPDGSERTTRVVLDGRRERFEYASERAGHRLEGELAAGECVLRLDGSSDFDPERGAEIGLSCDRLQLLRNYYSYLWGLPMKLRDPGTRLDPEATATTFMDREVLALRVTYEEAVGSDTWYFYLDPVSRALVGYRFYHDEDANDGEYIVLEGELKASGLRLPQRRAWYTNAGDELLGVDTLRLVEHLE